MKLGALGEPNKIRPLGTLQERTPCSFFPCVFQVCASYLFLYFMLLRSFVYLNITIVFKPLFVTVRWKTSPVF